MNILIVSCVFHPEPVVSSKSSFSLAVNLASKNHKVRVLAPFPSRPSTLDYPKKKLRLYFDDRNYTQFNLIRCYSFFSRKSQLISRFLENLTFGLSSSLYILFSKKPDVIYANTWPIFASFLLACSAKIRGIPLISSVQDLYPETLINQGRFSKNNYLVNNTLQKIDKFSLSSSHTCIAISEGFKNAIIKKGINQGKISVVCNWNTSSEVDKGYSQKNFKELFKLDKDSFLVMYAGNISSSAGVKEIINIFSNICLLEKRAYLCIAGEGSQHKSCMNLVDRLKCKNIFFYYPWKSNETESLLNSADLLILPTLGDQALYSVPSKLISYMQARKAIFTIAHSKSDLYSIVLNSKSGWAVELDEAEDRLLEAIKTPAIKLNEYGINAFNYGNKYFNANLNLEKLADIITIAKKNI